MTLLQEIEDGASGDGMSLGTLLHKCLVLASRLGSQPAIDWIEWELNGYPEDATLPDYRMLSLIIKANMVDFGKQVTGWSVPPAFLGKDSDLWTKLRYRNSVVSIEHLLRNTEATVHFQMGNLPLFLSSQKFTDMEITSAWGETSASQLKHILETVRTRVFPT